MFTIIVLGEVIVSVVSGVAEQPLSSWPAGGYAFLGMMIAIGLWLLAPVFFGILVWIKVFDARELEM